MGTLVAFGEAMLRLSPPGRERLLQTPKLDVWIAGAEANVAIGLACLGHPTALATVVPDNDLGRAAIGELRRHGVDCSRVRLGGERMGLYFVTPGAGLRATEVVYDRTHSSFGTSPADAWDWARLLDGADRLHLSGITPALGDDPARAALAGAEAATARGIPVSFDGNYRANLWARREGSPAAILTELVRHADLLFGNHRDIALLLGTKFDGESEDRDAAAAAFAAFPRLEMIASTTRQVRSSDSHLLSARIDTRDRAVQTADVALSGIVDRIGAGDAFAVGVSHALRLGESIEVAAQTGLNLACLKHSLPGDASLFTRSDLAAFVPSGADVRR